MRWLLRFALWSAALAIPFLLLAGVYQRALLAGVASLLGIRIPPPSGTTSVDLSAANALGIYAAMCLASTAAPWKVRARSLALGLAGMVLVEFGAGFVSVLAGLRQASPETSKALDALLAVPRYTSAPGLWLLLLGRHEIPSPWRDRLWPGPAPAPTRRSSGS
jgi:hypothetical protein